MQAHDDQTTRRSAAHTTRLALGLVLLAVLIAVAFDNTSKTRVGYVLGDVRAPLVVVLALTGLIGALIGWLLLHRPHRHH